MKILQDLRANYITSVSEAYTSKKTGQQGYLYYVTIMVLGKAATLSCTKEAYDKMGNLEVMNVVDFVTEYNMDYKTYRIVDVL